MLSVSTRTFPALACAVLLSNSLAAQEACEFAEIRPQDSTGFQAFGSSVAMDGNLLVVGADQDNEAGLDKGAVYLFERSGDQWLEIDKFLPDRNMSERSMGESVAIQGETFVAGATRHCASCAGAVYVFEPDLAGWSRTRLVPAESTLNDSYGASVDLDGDTIVVGSSNYHVGGGVFSGAVFVWKKVNSNWIIEDVLVASDGATGHLFGVDVALLGDRLIVGAEAATGATGNTGAAYVFERVGGNWTEVQKLALPAGENWDYFGRSLVAEGDRLAIGALGVGNGTVELYEHDGADYQPIGNVAAPAGSNNFGNRVELRGDRMVVGSIGLYQVVATYRWSSGLLPVFEEMLIAGDRTGPTSGFGDAFDVQGDMVVIGDLGDNDVASNAGSAYTYLEGHTPPGATFCECGDSGLAPCGNIEVAAGCAHSGGVGARIRACRTTSLGLDNLVVLALDTPIPAQFSVFVMGDASILVPFRDGLRCAGGNLFRFPIQLGLPHIGPGIGAYAAGHFGAMGTLEPGDTRIFQAWFRDPGGPCGTGANLSNAVSVTFTP